MPSSSEKKMSFLKLFQSIAHVLSVSSSLWYIICRCLDLEKGTGGSKMETLICVSLYLYICTYRYIRYLNRRYKQIFFYYLSIYPSVYDTGIKNVISESPLTSFIFRFHQSSHPVTFSLKCLLIQTHPFFPHHPQLKFILASLDLSNNS